MILCGYLGLTPAEVDAIPARDIRRLRRHYCRHPFGSLRGDYQAWLAGSQARTAFGGRPFQFEQVGKLFAFGKPSKREQRKAKRVPKSRLTSDKLKAWVLSMGGNVEEKKE